MRNFDQVLRYFEDLGTPYNGRLDAKTLAAGIKIVLANSRSIADDAELLLEHGRYARALALSISCLEEVGKAEVLADMARIPPRAQRLWRSYWRHFRRHEYKSVRGSVHLWEDAARRDPFQVVSRGLAAASIGKPFERIRRLALYVDYLASTKEWFAPEIVNESSATTYVQLAAGGVDRQSALEQAGLYSEAALRLRHEAYGPVVEKYPDAFVYDAAEKTILETTDLLADVVKAHELFFKRLASELDIEVEHPFQWDRDDT